MKIWKNILKFFKNVKHFFVGNYRAWKLKRGLKKVDIEKLVIIDNNWENINVNAKSVHTVEQFIWRTYTVMNKSRECLFQDSTGKSKCKKCGCTTPELFFADKGCEGGCYGPMMSKEEWAVMRKELDINYMFNKIKSYL